ncbi:MAG: cation diffusion facilitator family transporter [bacterium]|nr:cation diffusion facilitator family transporter [bacterium]
MKEQVALISILANLFLALAKISTGLISKSSAVLSSGIDSLVDILASLISYLGIKISKKPADEKHPYGHHKFEVLSGFFITLFIFAGSLAIFYQAFKGFVNPAQVSLGWLPVSVMVASLVVNLGMSKLKIYFGKKENSISLLSDGIHSRLDVLSSLLILIGLFLNKYWLYLDSVLALLVGLYVFKVAFSLGKEAIDSLLDVSANQEIENKMKELVKEENIELACLKTQKKGSAITANLEIGLPQNLTVEKASQISDSLRKKLMQKIGNLSYVVIQIKSHNLETDFYQPKLGGFLGKTFGLSRGFGWQSKGRFKGNIQQAQASGPGGYCLCQKCGYKIKHTRGKPCSVTKCPKCKTNLKRA